MARLIIGHVTDESATVWVRAEESYPYAHVTVENADGAKTENRSTEARHGYTSAVTIRGLSPSTAYRCRVRYSADGRSRPHRWVDFGHCEGEFVTFPSPGEREPFTFLLGSCNLHSLRWVANPDPAFEELTDRACDNGARFMIHCGDQIYYDIPYAWKAPSIEEYREKYRDAWRDSRPTRHFLTRMPQYMTLGDHEITDNFANDFDSPSGASPWEYRKLALKVYREYVHIRQPQDYGRQALYYEFSFGDARFFVTDTRSERFGHDSGETRIMSDSQLAALKGWLKRYRDQTKFVVTAVPFVGEVRNDHDKWSAPEFRHQKEELLDYLADNGIGRLVFLTGDMHSSYYARLRIQDGETTHTVHELMSSPINQLEKSSFDLFSSGVSRKTPGGRRYSTVLRKRDFYNAHSNAMLIRVDGREVEWSIFRTKKTRKEKTRKLTL